MPQPAITRRTAGLAAALIVTLAAGGAAAQQTVKEPGSGVAFAVQREVVGRGHTIVGVGLRKILLFKVYAAALYVGDADGKPSFQKLLEAAGGDLAQLRRSRRLYDWITGGDYGRALECAILRDIDKGKMAKTIREKLEGQLGDLTVPEYKDLAERFFAAIDIPLKKGQRFAIVQAPGYEIIATLDERVLVRVRNRKIANAIWRVYFGAKVEDAELKKTLLDHIETLTQ